MNDKTELHTGKLTVEAKTMVTEEFDDLLKRCARSANCLPQELVRDALYLAMTGKTFTEHVANDRRSMMALQGPKQGDKGASRGHE